MDRSQVAVIGLAIIWAAVILASALVLREQGSWDKMLPILRGGATASIIVVGGALRRR
ncbi:MAG: hypothetical protein ACETWG_11535 [Candidatus Neomarinimicrobiota bacterium]